MARRARPALPRPTARRSGAEEIAGAREKLGWRHKPFEVPKPVLAAWRAAGTRHRAAYEAWTKAAGRLDAEARAHLTDPVDAKVARAITRAVAAAKADFAREGAKLATRQSSQKVLERLVPVVPGLIGGSADLTGSNGTLTKLHKLVKAGDFAGNYIHYGVREHGMAAAMNGIALHGGIVPYGGSFLVFTDYCRPSIRLSALMGQRVIYVMTHDSIGLGEDGPTHQPVEHLASLRAIPNLNVFRPADSVECAECWELALHRQGHAVDPGADAPRLAGAPHRASAREPHRQRRLCADRAEGQARRDPDRHRLGSVARRRGRQAARRRRDQGRRRLHAVLRAVRRAGSRPIATRCSARPRASRSRPQPDSAGRDGSAPNGAFVGMRGFGASAPAQDLYTHFGITADAVAAAARDLTSAKKRKGKKAKAKKKGKG